MSRQSAAAAFTLTALLLVSPAIAQEEAPFDYLWATAYAMPPETTNEQSGYFSLCEGLNGRMYVGTAKYGVNAYLVEFDPKTEQQRIAIDVMKLTGDTRTGMGAQSKIHTRNFVGPSGRIYVGSKQGYAQKGENPYDYPGGYVIAYDPDADVARNFGMIPFRAHGVGDVVADEKSGVLYICTQDDQARSALWLRYDVNRAKYETLFSTCTFYAMTLLDKRGWAHVLSKDNKLVSYDPVSGRLFVKTLTLDGEPFLNEKRGVPTWIVADDGMTAYLLYMSEPGLYRLNLGAPDSSVPVEFLGNLLEASGTDSRCSLSQGPDGRFYAVISEPNKTGFGRHKLHHIARYDPKDKSMRDLGVLAVKNPDFFFGYKLGESGAKDENGKGVPWTHGFHTLPDGTLTPLYNHMALVVASNGDGYVTIIYPYTLLRIEGITRE